MNVANNNYTQLYCKLYFDSLQNVCSKAKLVWRYKTKRLSSSFDRLFNLKRELGRVRIEKSLMAWLDYILKIL